MSVAPEFPFSVPDPAIPLPEGPDDHSWAEQICRHAVALIGAAGRDTCTMIFFVGAPGTDADPDTRHIGIKDLEGAHPLAALLDFVAPASWRALGVAATARARHLDRADEAERVISACAITRDGTITGRVVFGSGQVIDDPPTEGEIPDALRRAMGLPTAPPESGPATLFTLDWLAAVVEAAEGGRVLDRQAAMRLHPACATHDPDAPLSAGYFLRVARALSSVASWELLRGLAADGRRAELDLTADDAAWMDEGMFARWVMARRPTFASLLERLHRAGPPGLMVQLSPLLAELELEP